MVEVITAKCLSLLQFIAKHPNVSREQLGKVGAPDADIHYLEQHDLIREQREIGHYRISHMGELALKRGL